jgi:hypothetical protein
LCYHGCYDDNAENLVGGVEVLGLLQLSVDFPAMEMDLKLTLLYIVPI